ncbi:hypothetical protein MCOR27_003678 [Pyricularia oryzae]|uniref:Uncharacterized protein n=1 Tax=Pyricularia grisea TaxID=148305 RepID=A0ABQ8NYA0_PYRGI|nr:hypothetical protein MCOR01_003667 [Pyricularia oryzae]KAI6303702.1 hypothetical protein MCOR33_001225 [Pyricularia grisea]KAI6265062.1 hypothetical protein MCOR26_010941 [Pyricularia oryzae]KAI6282631.1 hypothetical protein MCOR27_003678 [Pyricularia oryzae]KAI6315661.1 hypothetical protein MCOR29_006915 [Pyricularia oryzae]
MAAHEDESDFPIEHHLSTTKDADNTTEKEQAQLAGLADQQRARPRKEGLAQEVSHPLFVLCLCRLILAPHSMAILPSRPTGSLLSPGPRSHREVMLALVMTYAAVTLELVSTTDATLFGGKFLNGFAIGFLQSVTVTYIGDVSRQTPMSLKQHIYLDCNLLLPVHGSSSIVWAAAASASGGLFVLTVVLFVMAALAVAGSPGAIKGTVGLTLVYCCWHNVTIGATAYTILCEVVTARLRVKTIAIGSSAQALLNMMWSFVLPYLFNPDTANLGTKIISFYLWRAIAVLSLVYAWLCFPKTATWTREKLDEMFIKGVPARKFKTYKPDAEVRCEKAQARLQ